MQLVQKIHHCQRRSLRAGKVTREQIAKILYDYAQRTGNDTSADATNLNGFSDAVNISDWARQAMVWAATHGIIKGNSGRLNLQGTATRTQVAQIFYNCRNFLTKTVILAPQATWVVDMYRDTMRPSQG